MASVPDLPTVPHVQPLGRIAALCLADRPLTDEEWAELLNAEEDDLGDGL